MPKSRSIVFLLVVVVTALTLVEVKGQTGVSHTPSPSAGFSELSEDMKIRDIATFLASNDTAAKMLKIAQSLFISRMQQPATNGSSALDSIMPTVLQAIPEIFNSSFFRLALSLTSDEIGKVRLNVEEKGLIFTMAAAMTQPAPLWSAPFNETLQKLTILYKMTRANWADAANRYLQSVSPLDLLYAGSSQQATVTRQCFSDSMEFLGAIASLVSTSVNSNNSLDLGHYMWALKMFDSFGKPTGGILKGGLTFVGSYEECRDAHAHVPHADHVTDFGGRYCRVTFNLPDAITNSFGVDTHGITLRLHWGMCIPDSCHKDDLRGIFRLGNLSDTVHSIYCPEEEDIEDDSSAIAAVVILALLGSAMVLCTLTEAWIRFSHNNFPRSSASTPTHSSIEDPEVSQEDESKRPETSGLDNAAFQLNERETKLQAPAPQKSNDTSLKEVELQMPTNYMHHKENPLTASAVTNLKEELKRSSPPPSYTKSVKDNLPQHEPHVPNIVKAFSMLTNMPKLLNGKKSPKAIHCLHGIRLFSLLWVILGHTYNYGVISVVDSPTAVNLVDADAIFKRFSFQGIMAGEFSVDTFFMLSGLLVTWLTLKDLDKKQGAGYWLMFYVHRFWRLTPIYMMVLMMFGCLHKYLGGGPLWPETLSTAENCKSNWWTNLLYVNNLVKVDDMCMGWTWYLANDMQFYWISPIFLLAMSYLAPLGIAMTVGLMLAGIGSAAYFEYKNGGDLFSMHEDNGFWNEVYITPWCRVAAYAVGMLLGYIIYKTKQTTLRMRTAVIGWLLTWGVGVFLCYINYTQRKEGGEQWSKGVEALYQSVSRPLWATCVAWIIYACHNNRGGFINSILSWEGFLPLSRLTYAAYLLHPIIMMLHLFSKKALIYIDDFDLAYLYMGHTVTTFLTAFFFSLLAEAPALTLEKMVFRMR